MYISASSFQIKHVMCNGIVKYKYKNLTNLYIDGSDEIHSIINLEQFVKLSHLYLSNMSSYVIYSVTLTNVILYKSYNNNIILPDNITHMTVNKSLCIDMNVWPQKLMHLTLGECLPNHRIYNLPDTLECIVITTEYININITWPKYLIKIYDYGYKLHDHIFNDPLYQIIHLDNNEAIIYQKFYGRLTKPAKR